MSNMKQIILKEGIPCIGLEIEVWYSGESLENDLKKGMGLDILFPDIELLQKNGIKEILYFMSMDKKILIIKRNGQEEFYGKLKNMPEQLPTDFLMIHQSYIIHQESDGLFFGFGA